MFLNNEGGYKNFKELLNSKYVVDKTNIISILNGIIGTKQKYVCITKPRRFGKSSVIDMLGAYYSEDLDSSSLFKGMNIEQKESFSEHLNKYNVIKLDFSRVPFDGCTYKEYMDLVIEGLEYDLKTKYTEIDFSIYKSLSLKLEATNEQFIFLIDEWDFIFNQNIYIKNHENFLSFLRLLLKDQPYVSLCYMTGILPIKKHTSKSALNMFYEYTFINDSMYDSFFGFTDEEVRTLVNQNGKIEYEEVENWYNGYTTKGGFKVYNPKSVIEAMINNVCQSYWTSTGAFDEVYEYLKLDIGGISDDVIKMVNGEEVDRVIKYQYRAGDKTPETLEEIYSAMIVLGFLSYDDGYISIPNKELMLEFETAVSRKGFGDVARLVNESKTMLEATVKGDTDKMAEILHIIHNIESPILQYNDENSLSSVVTLAYLYARNIYTIKREEKAGKGYVDFIFRPRRKRDKPIVLELKKDDTVDNALKQIKEKEYTLELKREYEDREIVIAAICYDFEKKEHTAKVEYMN